MKERRRKGMGWMDQIPKNGMRERMGWGDHIPKNGVRWEWDEGKGWDGWIRSQNSSGIAENGNRDPYPCPSQTFPALGILVFPWDFWSPPLGKRIFIPKSRAEADEEGNSLDNGTPTFPGIPSRLLGGAFPTGKETGISGHIPRWIPGREGIQGVIPGGCSFPGIPAGIWGSSPSFTPALPYSYLAFPPSTFPPGIPTQHSHLSTFPLGIPKPLHSHPAFPPGIPTQHSHPEFPSSIPTLHIPTQHSHLPFPPAIPTPPHSRHLPFPSPTHRSLLFPLFLRDSWHPKPLSAPGSGIPGVEKPLERSIPGDPGGLQLPRNSRWDLGKLPQLHSSASLFPPGIPTPPHSHLTFPPLHIPGISPFPAPPSPSRSPWSPPVIPDNSGAGISNSRSGKAPGEEHSQGSRGAPGRNPPNPGNFGGDPPCGAASPREIPPALPGKRRDSHSRLIPSPVRTLRHDPGEEFPPGFPPGFPFPADPEARPDPPARSR
ncbi:uncharacterized protein LOC135410711 [Pseudopipra pipra]|uniref:uncharacterized protein LOC135410711 n=1 Tax=Pseudopipra pipra TaxID=415032 RepID=UPI00313979FF